MTQYFALDRTPKATMPVPKLDLNCGGEEVPRGGWRGGEEVPRGGWR